MKILLTGGAGFIGQHLARALAKGHDVVAVDSLNPQVHRDPEASLESFAGRVVRADITDGSVWEQLPNFDAVVHLAAETGTAQSMYETERYRQVNVEGTRRVIEAARAWGAPLVALSSRAVYGEGRYRNPANQLIFGSHPGGEAVPEASCEGDELVPVSIYGETKVAAEELLQAAATEIPVTILRPQNVIGPGQALHNPYTGVLAAFLARLREGLPVQIYGDGHQSRDFVHVHDLVELICWSLNRSQIGEAQLLNCGTGERTTLTQLAQYAIEASPTGGTLEYLPVHRAGDIEHACADLTRLKSLQAPLPKFSSKVAVADFIKLSWEEPGADSSCWESALAELKERGLADE